MDDKLNSKSIKLLHLQAVLGGTVTVPTLTGNVTVKVCFLHFIQSLKFLLPDVCQSVQDGSVDVLMIALFVILFVQVRQGTQPGEKVVLRGKGWSLELP